VTPAPAPVLLAFSVAIIEPANKPPTAWQFQPTALVVKLGATIRWVNNGSTSHDVTADNGRFTSGSLDPKATFSFTPIAAGTFTYTCTFHPWMKGTVTVAP
jgi:plastocyanin